MLPTECSAHVMYALRYFRICKHAITVLKNSGTNLVANKNWTKDIKIKADAIFNSTLGDHHFSR